jgi:DNA (cytosine-5)-methyltransferase 1
MSGREIRVVELFAGVGGFRLGLDGHPNRDSGSNFKTMWSNQWEPSQNVQWASKVYVSMFGSAGHSNEDINSARHEVPEHDLLVGGFPCQDYSTARTRSGEMGIKGEKGKLWTPIKQIIRDATVRPKVVLLENVPRLLNSPSKNRGLNFAVICGDLLSMGYDVEWRVINASEYGMPQQRRRVFIMAYRRATQSNFYRNGKPNFGPKYRSRNGMTKWLTGKDLVSNDNWESGPFASAFPLEGELPDERTVFPELAVFDSGVSPFKDCGYAWKDNHGGKWLWTFKSKPIKEVASTLRSVIDDECDSDYIIDEDSLNQWSYVKGSKKEYRIRKSDRENVGEEVWSVYKECLNSQSQEIWDKNREIFEAILGDNGAYRYLEGPIAFPDSLDNPSRTIVTQEIGRSPDRMRHIIRTDDGRWRRLSPIELERLNMFPDDWTLVEGIPDSRRGFLMGNALVVGIIERLRAPLSRILAH